MKYIVTEYEKLQLAENSIAKIKINSLEEIREL